MIHTTGSNKNDEIMKLRWGEPIMSVYHWSRSIKQCVPGQTRPCEQTVDHQTKCLQGVPKKIRFKPIFEFLNLGGVFLGVKNNSKNIGNKKNIRLFSRILSK